jgi:hypothetical protein
MSFVPAISISKIQLDDPADTDLDLALTIIHVGDTFGMVNIATRTGEQVSLSLDMVRRVASAVRPDDEDIHPAFMALVRAEADAARMDPP